MDPMILQNVQGFLHCHQPLPMHQLWSSLTGGDLSRTLRGSQSCTQGAPCTVRNHPLKWGVNMGKPEFVQET